MVSGQFGSLCAEDVAAAPAFKKAVDKVKDAFFVPAVFAEKQQSAQPPGVLGERGDRERVRDHTAAQAGTR